MNKTLIAVPQVEEAKALLGGFRRRGHPSGPEQTGKLGYSAIPSLDMVVAVGGHGKAQFAVQTQYLIDQFPDVKRLFCVGAAGRLSDVLDFGDIVVGTATIEHDYKLRFVREPLPRHQPDATLLQEFRGTARANNFPFGVHFGPVASGDEDIVDLQRAGELRTATEAVCVAWEGSGGARAAEFNDLSFLEIRCITDSADPNAVASFHKNLDRVMPNIADLLIRWHLS